MAIELNLYTTRSPKALAGSVRSVLTLAREEPGANAVTAVFFADHLSISIGRQTDLRAIPTGTLAYESFVYFRLDKFALTEATVAALTCVRVLLEDDRDDVALDYLSDHILLTRIKGMVRAYSYKGQRSFWDSYDPQTHLGVSVDIVRLPPPRR